MSPVTTKLSASLSSPSLLEPTTPRTKISISHRSVSSDTTNYRHSEYSTHSVRSRSSSNSLAPPDSPSNLPFTIVRDFAYSVSHPMHCAAMVYSSQHSSSLSSPVSESADCLSDSFSQYESKNFWTSGSFGQLSNDQPVAQINFEDGPPWSEDEDLQSPVVSSRHRKQKPSGSNSRERVRSSKKATERLTNMMGQSSYVHNGGFYLSQSGDACQRFYMSQGDKANANGSDIIAYSSEKSRHFDAFDMSNRRDSHFAGTLPKQTYTDVIHDFIGSETSSNPSSPGTTPREESRYSRDYQFTITSSDEEMHGQAVALFDFISENENELPLIEGQVIWVSYRHGQGWLVAEDPKTQESGLVPESYVRLLREIHGDLKNTTAHVNELLDPFHDSTTQSTTEYEQISGKFSNSYDYHAPIVSTFSTSSLDLNPYPHYLLATYAGQAPPQVIHYQGQRGGSRSSTPINGTTPKDLSSTNDAGNLYTQPIATLPPEENLQLSNPSTLNLTESKGNIQSEPSGSEIESKINSPNRESGPS